MADIKLLKEMGERIFLRRKSLKMTQEALAERIGVSTQMISNLELGRKKAIRPENLIKICQVLNISADYVFTGNSTGSISDIESKLANLTPEELRMIKNMIEYMSKKD